MHYAPTFGQRHQKGVAALPVIGVAILVLGVVLTLATLQNSSTDVRSKASERTPIPVIEDTEELLPSLPQITPASTASATSQPPTSDKNFRDLIRR